VLRLPCRDLACILGQPPMLFLGRANVLPVSYTAVGRDQFQIVGNVFLQTAAICSD
jgi:hypothetical protein